MSKTLCGIMSNRLILQVLFQTRLDEWINHFVELPKNPLPHTFTSEYLFEQAYACYNPWNMQTRYLTQAFNPAFQLSEDWKNLCQYECHFVTETFEPSVETAKSVLTNQIYFVGIIDLYVETLCLLQWNIHKTVPQTCACGGAGPLEQLTHTNHNVPDHDIADVAPDLFRNVKKLIQKDLKLYAIVLDRFEEELHIASQKTGVQMVCPDRFKRLRDDIAFWEDDA